jgi:hypothetical protein
LRVQNLRGQLEDQAAQIAVLQVACANQREESIRCNLEDSSDTDYLASGETVCTSGRLMVQVESSDSDIERSMYVSTDFKR